jgi:phage terminase small subunit
MHQANQVEQSNSHNLTDKQRAFVLEYVKDWNGTQAAIRAGYSENCPSETAYELLRKPQIRQFIDRHFEDMGLTAERILAEQMALAFANADDYLEVEEGGESRAKAFNSLTRKQKAAVKKIREKRIIKENPDGSVFVDSTMEYELYDKQKALDVLGKHTSGRERINAPSVEHQPDLTKQPAQQIGELMTQVLSQAQAGQIDPVVAKSLATLATALLKANEQGELEERIAALEAVQSGSKADSLDIDFE